MVETAEKWTCSAVNDDDQMTGAARPARGRPRIEADKLRPRRIVTFVTEAQFKQLQKLALTSDRSLSFVVYRMIAEQLNASWHGERRGEDSRPL